MADQSVSFTIRGSRPSTIKVVHPKPHKPKAKRKKRKRKRSSSGMGRSRGCF